MRRLIKLLLAVVGFTATLAAAQEIYQEKSLYRNIIVYEDQGLRCMKFGRHNAGRQTCISLQHPDALVLNYTKMLLGALYLNPEPQEDTDHWSGWRDAAFNAAKNTSPGNNRQRRTRSLCREDRQALLWLFS